MELLTHSRMSCAKACLRKHYLNYEMMLVKEKDSEARAIGSLVHDGLELGAVPPKPDYPEHATSKEDRDAFDAAFAKSAGLLEGYFDYWKDENIKVLAPEQEFVFRIPNPDTQGFSQTFQAAGKIDMIIELEDGRKAIMEHKTTTDSLLPESDYWKRLEMDQQISLYWLGADSLGYEIETIVYNVIKRPGIRPKKIWACSKCNAYAGEKKTGAACSKGCELHKGQIHQRTETPEEYKQRLVNDIKERPEFYFARREIPRLQADLREFKAELWQQSIMLKDCKRMGFWFRNTSICLHPYRCDYLDICNIDDDFLKHAPDGFKFKKKKHSELSGRMVISS